MKKKVLIVGGSSKIGKNLINTLDKKSYQIYSTFNKNINI